MRLRTLWACAKAGATAQAARPSRQPAGPQLTTAAGLLLAGRTPEIVAAELFLETLDPACGVNELLLPGVEGVTEVTDFDLELGHGGSSFKSVPAGAGYARRHVVWDVCLFSFLSQ
jgi:hypothetical protein